ncbi:MAG: hypothetical protein COC16_02830 [Lutibacter sp.]|nr:MAG: hypothetical protein COC16_02830 [Lutibacter sp.]
MFAQGPPITVETPVMLGLEGSGIRTFGKFISKKNGTIYVQPIAIPYNISTKFQVGGIIPLMLKRPDEGETISGFGDLILFAKYQIYKKDEIAKTVRILANIKQTFPTGKTGIGLGISQTYVGIIMGNITTGIGVYSDFGYHITSDDTTDNFTYNFSIGIPLLSHQYPQKQLNTFLEFNGNYLFVPKVHTVFISPGFQFIPGRRILVETSFQIPVVQKNVLANKTNYMVLLGTRFLLN